MSKIGKILLAVVEIAAIIALSYYAPGIAVALTNALGVQISAFAVVAIGSVVISLSGSLISNALFRTKTDMSSSKVNVRLEEPPRWICAGQVLQGGGVVFAEFDANGNLWWVVVHSDSIVAPGYSYYLDTVLVTVDPATREVITPDFLEGSKRYFKIWTHTYSEANPIPPVAAELAAIFPGKWDAVSHLLVGTTYSVLYGRSIKIADRYKVYRWRGVIGLGEPNIAVLGQWSNMYDPRDPTQTLGDRTTYKPSRNSAIVWAWWRTHRFGRNKPETDINWQRIAEQANICDEQVVGIASTQPRYECAVAAQDNVDRSTIEQQIMLSCDGQIVFDDDGKTWMRVGKYYVPTLALSRNRDVITMETQEAQDGESETQGVVVRYIDHDANYTLQPSAPWYNPNYYNAGEGNTFLTVDIPTCSNHNQAMRLAKSIGMRSQPLQKAIPTVGLRGLRAMQERVINLNYDNVFAGDYEIATPVEVDESGMFCSLGLVPIAPDRFDLLAGEEKPKPNAADASSSTDLTLPNNVSVVLANNRIEAHFDVPLRDDVSYDFQYIAQSQYTGNDNDQWADMSVDMDSLFAYSGAVDTSKSQYVRWRTVSSGGTVTAWYDPPYLLSISNQLPPPNNLTVNGSAGAATVAWKNPNDIRFYYSDVWRGTTNVFNAATRIVSNYAGGVGQVQQITDTIAAGTYYYWVVAHQSDGTASVAAGPASGIVT